MSNTDELDLLVFIQGAVPRKLHAKAAATIGDVLGLAGAEPDLLAFDADTDEDGGDADVDLPPLPRDRSILGLAVGRKVTIHCHRCRQIQVLVNYQKDTIRRKFSPSTKVRKVLRWAKRKFTLTDADADNLALFECASGELIRDTMHLGELVTADECELCFNLSKDRNIEGHDGR